MRLAAPSWFIVVFAVVLCAACDSHTLTSGAAAGRVTLAIPKPLAVHDGALAAQTSTTDNGDDNGDSTEVAKLRIRISIAGASRTLLDRGVDPNAVCSDNADNSDSACTLTVEFHIWLAQNTPRSRWSSTRSTQTACRRTELAPRNSPSMPTVSRGLSPRRPFMSDLEATRLAWR